MVTVYHGTVAAFIPAIQKVGLRFDASHAWRVQFDSWGELDPPTPHSPAIYVTKNQPHAIEYAQTRADYFQRKPGECFAFYNENPERGMLYLSKDEDAPVLHTIPVLLTILLPESVELTADPEDTTGGLRCFDPIPASAITAYTELKPKYNPQRYTSAVRQRIDKAAFLLAVKKGLV